MKTMVTSGRVTIYDVAAHAGVSIATVSNALNAPGRVKPATLGRVMAAVDALGYVPKTEAVSRARRGVRRIGVIAPFATHPVFAIPLNAVLHAAREVHDEIVVYDQESATRSRLVSLPLTGRVDGLIVMALPLSDDVAQRLIDQSIPTVLIQREHPDFSSVSVDNITGGRLVAEHLLARGHRRCGFLGHKQPAGEELLEAQARLNGFRARLALDGVALGDEDVRTVEPDFEAARTAALELLGRDERPTAIFAHDDVLASGVLRAAREFDLDVPGDVAVVGFDDSPLAAPLGLTSVRVPFVEMGEQAFRLVHERRARAQRSVVATRLGLELIERETS